MDGRPRLEKFEPKKVHQHREILWKNTLTKILYRLESRKRFSNGSEHICTKKKLV